MKSFYLCFIWILVFLSNVPSVNATQTVYLDTRENVRLELEIFEPQTSIKSAIIMFPGGRGTIEPVNYVLRTAPQFVENGYLVVVIGLPSDNANEPLFRISPAYGTDIKKTIEYVRAKYNPRSFYALGFSAGTVPAALHANRKIFDSENMSGIILISGVWTEPSVRRSIGHFINIPHPVLLVHHRGDLCSVSKFNGTASYFEMLKTKGRKDMLAVSGGSPLRALGDTCGPYHFHAFEGIENKVAAEIIKWMEGKEIGKSVEF